jgi:hypothetical protein
VAGLVPQRRQTTASSAAFSIEIPTGTIAALSRRATIRSGGEYSFLFIVSGNLRTIQKASCAAKPSVSGSMGAERSNSG